MHSPSQLSLWSDILWGWLGLEYLISSDDIHPSTDITHPSLHCVTLSAAERLACNCRNRHDGISPLLGRVIKILPSQCIGDPCSSSMCPFIASTRFLVYETERARYIARLISRRNQCDLNARRCFDGLRSE